MSKEKITVKDIIKKSAAFLKDHPVVLIVVLSYCVTFINEAFNRHSVWGATVFTFTEPFMFLANMSIIALCL